MTIFIGILLYIVIGFLIMSFVGLSVHTIKMPSIVYYLLIAMFYIPCVIGGVIYWRIHLLLNKDKPDNMQNSTESKPLTTVPDYFKEDE
jgi:dipeptide/tripeptide permease